MFEPVLVARVLAHELEPTRFSLAIEKKATKMSDHARLHRPPLPHFLARNSRRPDGQREGPQCIPMVPLVPINVEP